MPSILCFEKSFVKADNTTWTPARQKGVQFLGKELSARLKAQDTLGNYFPSVICVLQALQTANGVNENLPSANLDYGLWIDVGTDNYFPLIEIRQKGNNKIKCKVDANRSLTLIVEDDDDDAKVKRMTVAIPEDRSRVIGDSAGSLYVLGLVEDIDKIYGNATGQKPLNAAHYALASVTFRRCA